MKSFSVEITGRTPLMHHRMTDAYKTITGEYYIPLDYVSGAFKHVASDYKQTSGKKSYKEIAGGIFRPVEPYAILTDKKGQPLKTFEVDIRKATNHQAGAVAVCRPRFDEWKCKFTIEIDDTLIDPKVAQEILEDSGKRAGIGSFRVSKSGFFGQFLITQWKAM